MNRVRAHQPCDFVASQSRHADVEQRCIGAEGIDCIDRGASVVRELHVVSLQAHQHREALGRVAVVVGNDQS